MVLMVEDDPTRLTTWAKEYVDNCRGPKVDEYQMRQSNIESPKKLI